MSEDINNNLHKGDSAFPRQKPVQEDLVSLGVERFVEGGDTGLVRWAKEHAVQLTVGGFVMGYLLGYFSSRARSLEAL